MFNKMKQDMKIPENLKRASITIYTKKGQTRSKQLEGNICDKCAGSNINEIDIWPHKQNCKYNYEGCTDWSKKE